MKKRYLVDIFLLLPFLFIFTACSTVSKTDISEQAVKNAIDSANNYCSSGQYDLALEVYNTALQSISDYRLIYNKALVLAYMGQYEEAALVCHTGFVLFDYILAFKTAEAYYYELAGLLPKACSTYLEILQLNPYDSATRGKLIELYKTQTQYSLALEQANVLWEQGYKTSSNLSLIQELQELCAEKIPKGNSEEIPEEN